ncbi:hypothetical protein BDW71DRAFT_213205 [Aspergillus fruticulosus]
MIYVPDIPTNSPDALSGTDVEPSELITMEEGTSNTYVILVQGIANREWKSQKRWKTWRPWLDSMGLWDNNTIQAYNYDIETSNPAIFTKDGIEKEAVRLIESLTQHRSRQTIYLCGPGCWGNIGQEILRELSTSSFHDRTNRGLYSGASLAELVVPFYVGEKDQRACTGSAGY